MKEKETYITRMIAEREQLAERTHKLSAFAEKCREDLYVKEYGMMYAQLRIMQAYYDCLNDRIVYAEGDQL